MDDGGLSYRGLADAIRKFDEKGITHAHLNMLANGHDKPSMRAMELIARACSVSPEYFAEYRLSASSRRSRISVTGLVRAGEKPVPKHEHGNSPERNLVPPARDRVERADGDREQDRPGGPRPLNARTGHLRVAPEHGRETAGEETELVSLAEQFRGA
jgi:transcriptional regulator with XRE-family HTH domain